MNAFSSVRHLYEFLFERYGFKELSVHSESGAQNWSAIFGNSDWTIEIMERRHEVSVLAGPAWVQPGIPALDRYGIEHIGRYLGLDVTPIVAERGFLSEELEHRGYASFIANHYDVLAKHCSGPAFKEMAARFQSTWRG